MHPHSCHMGGASRAEAILPTALSLALAGVGGACEMVQMGAHPPAKSLGTTTQRASAQGLALLRSHRQGPAWSAQRGDRGEGQGHYPADHRQEATLLTAQPCQLTGALFSGGDCDSLGKGRWAFVPWTDSQAHRVGSGKEASVTEPRTEPRCSCWSSGTVLGPAGALGAHRAGGGRLESGCPSAHLPQCPPAPALTCPSPHRTHTCGEPWLGGRLLHRHGEGGRRWGGLSPGQRPVAAEGHRDAGGLH